MRISSRLVSRLGAVLCLATIWISCQSSRSLTIQGVTQFSTYNTPKSRLLSADDPSMKWIQFQERIDRELNQQVPEMGLSYSTSNPDLSFYVYGLGATLAQQPLFPYQINGVDIAGERVPMLTNLNSGSLVLDIVDPANNKLMWRGIIGFPISDEEQAYLALPNAIRVLLSKGSKALSHKS